MSTAEKEIAAAGNAAAKRERMRAACLSGAPQGSLLSDYLNLRIRTEELAEPLNPEDMVVQSMPDTSPAKWHLAHTTWFFETFLLAEQVKGYRVFDADYGYLFNSYYEAIGPRHPRIDRGLVTRPSVGEVMAYRRHVDQHMCQLLQAGVGAGVEDLVRLGLAHEEQHQELLLMDVLHLFSRSPLKPAYNAHWPADGAGRRGRFKPMPGGLFEMGHEGDGFAFDNEGPRHTTYLQPFEISDRLVTNGEWLEFMEAGGYRRPDLWLSDGWALVQAEGWAAPFYWQPNGEGWSHMSLTGLHLVNVDSPVVHLSYYEAAAFAHWSNARLPTEAEWEAAAHAGKLEQIDDTAWQWTQSAYLAYPGFRPAPNAVGEYNGKFMVNQMVLRGGASVTPRGHARLSYRNFFLAKQRWMFSGLRLARDLAPKKSIADADSEFAVDVIAGLSQKNKSLSPKYFYDAAGSDLFEAICLAPEYYLTRTETALLDKIVGEIAAGIPDDAAMIEFGSGASSKTRLLLDSAPQISMYVPIDISIVALENSAASLRERYPQLEIVPLAEDFTRFDQLPAATAAHPKVGFFPGSTIGNFEQAEAVRFLVSVRRLLGDEAQLIVGADLVKDEQTLLAAYDDAAGVTARFNKNVLKRINRELDGNFDLDQFDHLSVWNARYNRIEMHLVSRIDQVVMVAGKRFAFRAQERLHTENSHKFTIESFADISAKAGWRIERQWISEAPRFAIFRLVAVQ